MPIVCVNRPNRSKKRTWQPAGLTRITKEVCKNFGQKRTEQAVKAGFCGKTECERIAEEVLSAVAGAALGYQALVVLEGILEIRIISWVLRRTAAGRAFTALMQGLRLSIPNLAAKESALSGIEVALKTFIRTEGRVWIVGRPPPGF